MRHISMLVLMCAGAFLVRDARAEMTASEIYRKVSQSIVTVHGRDQGGKEVSQGSGVVIRNGVVASNCHVVEAAHSAVVRNDGQEFSARLLHWDNDIDLCSFQVIGLSAPPATFGRARSLQVGDEVFAVGAPQGFDLTLSDGIVSGLRPMDGEFVVQTTAAISPGSSGGGLFNSSGELVGITTMYLKDSQQMNFAVPVEWVNELPARSSRLRSEETKAAAVKDQVAAWERSIEAADPVGFSRRKDKLYSVAKALIGSVKQEDLLNALKAAYRVIVEEEEDAAAAAEAAANAAKEGVDAVANATRSRWYQLTDLDDEVVHLDLDSYAAGEDPEVWIRFSAKPGSEDAKKDISHTLVRMKTFCAERKFTISSTFIFKSNGDSEEAPSDYGRRDIAPDTIAELVHSAVCR